MSLKWIQVYCDTLKVSIFLNLSRQSRRGNIINNNDRKSRMQEKMIHYKSINKMV